jgi:hypothetical protein
LPFCSSLHDPQGPAGTGSVLCFGEGVTAAALEAFEDGRKTGWRLRGGLALDRTGGQGGAAHLQI